MDCVEECVCQFDIAKIARKDVPWEQKTDDITLLSSGTMNEEDGYPSNSLVLMNLGDKFGEQILEAKASAHGVLEVDISKEALLSLVKFANEGEIDLQNVADQTREELLQFSIRFSVPGLPKVCGEFLLETMAASNASKSFNTAKKYLCLHYQSHVRTYILSNFTQIAQEDPQFTSLVEFFDDILPDDELNVREEQLFLIQKLAEENPHMVSQLAKHTAFVRYLLIHPKVFEKEIAGKSLASNAIVQKNGMKLASDFFKNGDSKPAKRTPPKQLACKTRIPYEIVFVFGGLGGGPSIEVFDIRSNTWRQLRIKIPSARRDCGLEAIDDNVYLFGGFDGEVLNSTEAFSLKDNKWNQRCPMNKSRCQFSTAVHKGKIYAIGGVDEEEHEDTNSIECYDPKENSWTLMTPMTNARSSSTAVAYGNKIYVIGGFSTVEILNNVEVFDIETQEWTFGPSMSIPREEFAAVVYRQKIFVRGGDLFDRSVECLDLTQPSPSWSSAADMITDRYNFSATVVDDRILVMGGNSEEEVDGEAKEEAYSGDTGVWTPCPCMNQWREQPASVTVRGLNNAREYSNQKTIGL